MVRFRLIIIGSSTLFLLVACIATLVLAGFATPLFWAPEKPRPVRVALLAPLSSPTATVAAPRPAATKVVEAPPGLVEAAVKDPPATVPPTATATATPLPEPTATATAPASPGLPTRLVIPRLKLDRTVVLAPIQNETWQVDHLGQEVGYLEGTSLPGSDSNVVLAGHVTLAQGVYGPFAGLASLAQGDEVIVYADTEAFRYVVDNIWRVDPNLVEVTYPTPTGQVTLITCTNWDASQGRYQDRLVVRGHLVKS